jgi:hypothetical protein
MHPMPPVANPFAMMLDPHAVLASVAQSERLTRLQSRICRPLDKPLLGTVSLPGRELDEFDREVDAATEEDTDTPEA